MVVPDVREEPRFRRLDGVDQDRFVSMCSVPIVAGDGVVGVLNAQAGRVRHFSGADVRFLSAIAAQVAGVLARREQPGGPAAVDDLDARAPGRRQGVPRGTSPPRAAGPGGIGWADGRRLLATRLRAGGLLSGRARGRAGAG